MLRGFVTLRGCEAIHLQGRCGVFLPVPRHDRRRVRTASVQSDVSVECADVVIFGIQQQANGVLRRRVPR